MKSRKSKKDGKPKATAAEADTSKQNSVKADNAKANNGKPEHGKADNAKADQVKAEKSSSNNANNARKDIDSDNKSDVSDDSIGAKIHAAARAGKGKRSSLLNKKRVEPPKNDAIDEKQES